MMWKWLLLLALCLPGPGSAMDVVYGANGSDGGGDGDDGREKKGDKPRSYVPDDGEEESSDEDNSFVRRCKKCNRNSYLRKRACANPECTLWFGRLPGRGWRNARGAFHGHRPPVAPASPPAPPAPVEDAEQEMSEAEAEAEDEAVVLPLPPAAPPVFPPPPPFFPVPTSSQVVRNVGPPRQPRTPPFPNAGGIAQPRTPPFATCRVPAPLAPAPLAPAVPTWNPDLCPIANSPSKLGLSLARGFGFNIVLVTALQVQRLCPGKGRCQAQRNQSPQKEQGQEARRLVGGHANH